MPKKRFKPRWKKVVAQPRLPQAVTSLIDTLITENATADDARSRLAAVVRDEDLSRAMSAFDSWSSLLSGGGR